MATSFSEPLQPGYHSIQSTDDYGLISSGASESDPLLLDNRNHETDQREGSVESTVVDLGQPFNERSRARILNTFTGVFTPVALSMFSYALFQRLGFVVGQSGILLGLLQFVLAYAILYLTILSICSISTNGAVEGGGAYYMISRTLGPEFGGSIGALFFLANVFSCALYISGFVEGLTNTFTTLPEGRWWAYLYASGVLFLCLIVCIIGGAMFARTSVFILMIIIVCTLSVVVSMFIVPAKEIKCPAQTGNETQFCGNYTGFSLDTFTNNLYKSYSTDYVTEKAMGFATVFAILFSSVTGIMNGANMSGELKDPSKAIPKGTLAASTYTFITYIILAILTAFTCDKELLLKNYNYLKEINIWSPLVVIGIFSATLSAALGNLIGASRILEALAKDKIFSPILNPAMYSTKSGNPIMAVLISWILVQFVLIIGSLNAIAPMTSIFFLLSYASTNLTCLALELASAPNFRPTFKYFSWYTALLGLIGCLIMCFMIEAVYASIALVICMLMVILLHLRTFETSWGSISQALIFHQVRKYLLMLDMRKDHVKFWRPQMLLMVSNPLACCDLIEFINDVKKGGLYVLGHVEVGHFENEKRDPCQDRYPNWLKLVDFLKVKAFVELTMAASIREGMQHLIRISGLGGMKPNTICLGFYDHALPINSLSTRGKSPPGILRRTLYTLERNAPDATTLSQSGSFPNVRSKGEDKDLPAAEYVLMLQDIFKMSKNICLFRNFHELNKDATFARKEKQYIDVWPVNVFRPDSVNYFDNTCLFMLQLACILHMVPKWNKNTVMRIFMCTDAAGEETDKRRQKLARLLTQLRILGELKPVVWDQVTNLHTGSPEDDSAGQLNLSKDYLKAMNDLIKSHSSNTAVTFVYLPRVPNDLGTLHTKYLKYLEEFTADLPPTVLVHGVHPVTSTTL